jgi:type II restriction/modification system DNA methylase subunit YeeA
VERFVEAEWPAAEFIVGNPPFLGGKLMRNGLGNETVERLFLIFDDRVPHEADLVMYWFEKSLKAVKARQSRRVGLVATNSIRGGANRRVVDQIVAESSIFEAWSDEPWVVDGASVRVSLVCFGGGEDEPRLDGANVSLINADLAGGASDLTQARRLVENLDTAFMGDTKGGAFDVNGELARAWLSAPSNPNGRPNSDVLHPWRNGMDITRRSRDMWIVDFGWEMSESAAALYEDPFKHVSDHVRAARASNRRRSYAELWWRHVEPRPRMWRIVGNITRYIATPRIAKHRVFVFLDSRICPDSQIILVGRHDDTTFGILHSRFHEAWSLRLCTWLGVGNDPRYTPTTTFETFPFPEGLTPNISAEKYAGDPRAIAIAAAAKKLDDLRNAWLNPPDLITIEPEVVPGYPDRILPKDVHAAVILKKRTLTNLYNERPQWLADAHRDLDAAVAAAYGWPADISEEDALAKLLALNLARAAAGAAPEPLVEDDEEAEEE